MQELMQELRQELRQEPMQELRQELMLQLMQELTSSRLSHLGGIHPSKMPYPPGRRSRLGSFFRGFLDGTLLNHQWMLRQSQSCSGALPMCLCYDCLHMILRVFGIAC